MILSAWTKVGLKYRSARSNFCGRFSRKSRSTFSAMVGSPSGPGPRWIPERSSSRRGRAPPPDESGQVMGEPLDVEKIPVAHVVSGRVAPESPAPERQGRHQARGEADDAV